MTTLPPISHAIWDMKYRLKRADGRPLDRTVEDTWRRVARALARPEQDRAGWAARFEAALADFKFLPAGRIVAGAGTRRRVTLFNCFVMGTIPDDMGGIFQHLKEAALTLQQGGGIGYDFSTLRPQGAPVRGVGADASGPLSFMDVWDAMCRTIMSAGSRRGAMMATLRCDHPDIEAFIDAKREPGRLTMFNLSVLATEAFMAAVEAGETWPLIFNGETVRTVEARALWDRIMRATYETAEPGVIFIDRINRLNNLHYCETIASSNPCGEQPLPPYGACLLGSVNLAALVTDPFEAEARLDLEALDALAPTAVRMLDNAIDVSRFPLPAQKREAQAKRRIGLGVTGLADALAMVGLRYGSPAAVAATRDWMARLRRAAYLASAALAEEKGPFPLFEREPFLAGENIASLEPELREAIARQGLRNGLVTSIAPTGTISLLAGNVSSGLEPIFSLQARRTILMPDGSRREELVSDHAYSLYRRLKGDEGPPPAAFVDVAALEPEDHIAMQAAVQAFVDASVSKTINVPAELDFPSFKEVYRRAYDSGCKGCTTYRPSELRGSVLRAAPTAESGPPQAEEAALLPAEHPAGESNSSIVYMSEPLERPPALPGRTYKLRWPESDHAIYITLNDVVQDGRRRPFEIFVNSKNMEHYAWTLGLTRMISAVFRRGGDVSFVVEELKAVFDPRGGAWHGGRYVPSLLAAIGEVIERHMIDTGFLPTDAEARPDAVVESQVVNLSPEQPDPAGSRRPRARQCPKCGGASLVNQEGCDLCTACGYSRCA